MDSQNPSKIFVLLKANEQLRVDLSTMLKPGMQQQKPGRYQVGDSAEAWAKSIGKLLAGKWPADTLVLDFSQLRPAGERLKGYGWVSSGCSAISKAYVAIANILNGRADSLLTRMDILDIVNHLGTILSSRRSAEIALFDYGQPEWEEFAIAKKDFWSVWS